MTITAVWLYAALHRRALRFNLGLINCESMAWERDKSGDEDVTVPPEAECPALEGACVSMEFGVLEESTLSLKFSGGLSAIPLDGANSQFLIHPILRGYIPVFLNPLIRFIAVMDIGQSWDIILRMSAVVGTRPGEDLTNAFSALPT